jgi:hypothetical protein
MIISEKTSITLDDVKTALGTQNPHTTNASKIRVQIGRGSQSTIQRHLDTLRTAWLRLQEVPAVDMLPLPSAPLDVLNSIWSSAFEAARGRVAQHLASFSEQAAAAQITLSAQSEDKASLGAEIERLEAALCFLEENELFTAQKEADKVSALNTDLAAQLKKISSLEADCARLKSEQQAALHDVEIQLKTLQNVVDRSSERSGELRAELEHERARNQELVSKLESLARRPD